MQLPSDWKKKSPIFIGWTKLVPFETSLIFVNSLDSHVSHVRVPASCSEEIGLRREWS